MDDLYLKVTEDFEQLNRYLEKENLSQRLIRKVFREGRIFLDGIPARKSMSVHKGQEIRIIFEEEKIQLEPSPFSQEILYEDPDILVVNKRSNLAIMPCKSHPNETFANEIASYFMKNGIRRKVRLLGRLDKDTTGVMIICKNPYALYKMERSHTRDKVYHALVWGEICEPVHIDRPIGMGDDTMVREVRDDGKRAITDLWPIETNGKYTKIKLKLKTGRTHQIRCHLRYIGHPIVGDELYEGGLENVQGLFLHVAKFRFIHPRTNEEMVISAPYPKREQSIARGLLETC